VASLHTNIDNIFIDIVTLKGKLMRNEIPLQKVEEYVNKDILQKDEALSLIESVCRLRSVNLREWKPTKDWDVKYIDILEKYHVFPILCEEHKITAANSDPYDINKKNELELITGRKIEWYFAFQSDIQWANEQYHSIDNKITESITDQEFEEEAVINNVDEIGTSSFVKTILVKAIGQNVSDIHVEPKENNGFVRFRKDGILVEFTEIPKHLLQTVIAQFKVMANLDTAERRLPQDGRFKYMYNKRKIDIRISSVPVLYGEKLVLRLLDQHTSILRLNDLGFDEEFVTTWKKKLSSPHGLMLVTGPTGSGKSTTLYSTLSEMDIDGRNVVTLEDPIEYALPFANQVQINHKIGLTFAKGLRSLLRQDLDIMLLGEMRDLETAQLGIQASLTGHFVLTTLHTNSPEGAIVRLRDMGIPSYLIASSVLGVLSQRLARKLCTNCMQTITDSKEFDFAEQFLGFPVKNLSKSVGCPNCNHTGFSGRTVIYDWLEVDEHVKELINRDASEKEIRSNIKSNWKENQLRSLLENEVTSIQEIIRVLGW
jgi:type IV pilus assembly protein PilB